MFSIILISLTLIGNICPANSSDNAVSGIRTSFKDGIQRLVFDIAGEKEPAYYIKKDKNTLNLVLEAYLPMGKDVELKKTMEYSRYINGVKILHLPDEDELVISIGLKPGVSEESLSLPNPSRVVIDLSKNRLVE